MRVTFTSKHREIKSFFANRQPKSQIHHTAKTQQQPEIFKKGITAACRSPNKVGNSKRGRGFLPLTDRHMTRPSKPVQSLILKISLDNPITVPQ